MKDLEIDSVSLVKTPPDPYCEISFRERPILFNTPMVQAVLAGTKSQTRRAMSYPEYWGCPTGDCPHGRQDECNEAMQKHSPFGVPGDRLYIRETFSYIQSGYGIIYKADHTYDWQPKWKPNLHMKRTESRIKLEITDVRIQQVQDITEADAKAEGVERHTDDGVTYYGPLNKGHACPTFEFRRLWDSVSKKRGFGWYSNPWVWVIDFKVLTIGKN